MGYTTEFDGEVTIDPPLNEHEISYLQEFATTRRMHRTNGPYFVKGEGSFGQGTGPDTVLDYNTPPPDQPGLWCQWVPTEDGTALAWDGGEKFYSAPEWMKYLIEHFLMPGARASDPALDALAADPRFAHFTFNHVLNGEIDAQGEDPDDRWRLLVENNRVLVAEAVVTWAPGREV